MNFIDIMLTDSGAGWVSALTRLARKQRKKDGWNGNTNNVVCVLTVI